MPPQPHQDAGQELTAARREVQKIAALLRKTPLDLKDYHAVGEQMRRLSADPTIARRGSNWRGKVAELVGCSPSTLTKSLQFRLTYEPEDLSEVEKLGIGWSWLTIVLGVEDRMQRHDLLRKAKEGGWGERELQRAIQQLKGGRRGGGRPRREMMSQGIIADLCELIRLTELWGDFYDKVWDPMQNAYPAEIRRLQGPALDNLMTLLDDAHARLKDLNNQCKDAKAGVESLRQ